MLAGLRIDVDTLRGTRLGVPRLLSILGKHGLHGTFFFCVGPDNMGRHLWRLLRPSFLWKMLRTRAPSLYGWSILRCGVVGPGPDIGELAAGIILKTVAAGHEVGLHAWDHQRWQTMPMDDVNAVREAVGRGYNRLTDILGRPPSCSAAPAWRAPDAVLLAKQDFPFSYNSDCRGTDCFIPVIGDGHGGNGNGKTREPLKPQIPVTLPTYDELVGRDGVTDANYNAKLLDLFRPEGLNVLCVHAEVEGVAKAEMFEEFLVIAKERGVQFARLDAVLKSRSRLRSAGVDMRTLPGREGALCCQGEWLG